MIPRTRPPYSREFRIEAVRMLRAGMRSPKQLAEELGCSAQATQLAPKGQADRERQDVLSSEERQRLPCGSAYVSDHEAPRSGVKRNPSSALQNERRSSRHGSMRSLRLARRLLFLLACGLAVNAVEINKKTG